MGIVGHGKQWEFLKNNFKKGQLSHAYLFSGPEQVGKKFLAKEFVKFLNCLATPKPSAEAGTVKPCNECTNCKLVEKETYPDFMAVRPENGQEIKIEKIRDVLNFLSYRPYYDNSFKAVLIDNAERLNQEAQNCFLKNLEEPKGKTILFLISSKPELLLQTVRSRCQQVKFFLVPKPEIEKAWGVSDIPQIAELAEGRPGRAKQLLENPEILEKENKILQELIRVMSADLAEKFQYAKTADLDGGNLKKILEILQKYFRKLMLSKSGADTNFVEQNAFFKNYSLEKAKKVLKLIEEINQKILFTNINQKLALEILLMEV